MNRAFYGLGVNFGRFVKLQCIREVVLHRERSRVEGGCIFAVTHLSHLEPAVVSMSLRRPIHWMARKEFFSNAPARAFMRWSGAFSVNRQGACASSLRRAIELAKSGKLVGIFPEGGVKKQAEAAIRGGPIKRGVCVVSLRANVPIVPVVVLGTDRLNRVAPYLPARRGRLWIAFGEQITPRRDLPRRTARFAMADQLSRSFISLYHDLLATDTITDEQVP